MYEYNLWNTGIQSDYVYSLIQIFSSHAGYRSRCVLLQKFRESWENIMEICTPASCWMHIENLAYFSHLFLKSTASSYYCWLWYIDTEPFSWFREIRLSTLFTKTSIIQILSGDLSQGWEADAAARFLCKYENRTMKFGLLEQMKTFAGSKCLDQVPENLSFKEWTSNRKLPQH